MLMVMSIILSNSVTKGAIIVSAAVKMLMMFQLNVHIGLLNNDGILCREPSLGIERLRMHLILKRSMNLMMLKKKIAG